MKRNCPLRRFIAGIVFLILAVAVSAPAQSLITVSPPTQTLFEADFGSGDINEFTPSGVQSTFVSGLAGPGPLAFDSADNLYVGSDGITEITPGGAQSTFASFTPNPNGLAFNGAGNLFVTDGNFIIEITPEGMQSTYATIAGKVTANLAFDSAGNLFVTSFIQQQIYEVAPDGTVSIFATGAGARGALAFDSEGDLFTAQNQDIYEFVNNNGTLSTVPVLFASGLDGPSGLAFDSAGDLFEADTFSGNIYEFVNNDGTLGSTPVVFASGLDEPFGLAFAPVPEPSSLALLAIGTAALLIRRRKN
jgi:outer membrane protein assembly factor BamB